ncbi:MAG: hypothetical protein O9325_13975 [Roseomonas sp.]|nr:hypothetical protein [Roseomonas sp.]
MAQPSPRGGKFDDQRAGGVHAQRIAASDHGGGFAFLHDRGADDLLPEHQRFAAPYGRVLEALGIGLPGRAARGRGRRRRSAWRRQGGRRLGLARLHPQRRDLDRVVVVHLAVERVIGGDKGRREALGQRGVQGTFDRDLERVVLPVVAQVGAATDLGRGRGGQQRDGLCRQPLKVARQGGDIEGGQAAMDRPASLEGDGGGEQAEGGHDAGQRRHHHAPAAEPPREPHRMHRARTTRYDEGERGGRLALVGDIDATGGGHRLVDDGMDAGRGARRIEPGGPGDPRRDRRLGARAVEPHLSPQEEIRVQVTEREIGIGHGRRLAAQPVAGGRRI